MDKALTRIAPGLAALAVVAAGSHAPRALRLRRRRLLRDGARSLSVHRLYVFAHEASPIWMTLPSGDAWTACGFLHIMR